MKSVLIFADVWDRVGTHARTHIYEEIFFWGGGGKHVEGEWLASSAWG